MTIQLTLAVFLQIIFYIVFIDVILSWLTLFWLNLRPRFIADIIDPIYSKIKKILPTSFWPIDFTPIIIIFIIIFFKWIIYSIEPSIYEQLPNFLR